MTINQVLQRLRLKLRDQIKDVGSIASAVASGSTKIRYAEGITLGDGDYIEIDSEVLRIEEAEKLEDYLAGISDLTTAATAIKVETSGDFAANDFFRIDNEYIKVSKVSVIGSFNLKVGRGERGTTAAEHTRKSPIYMKTQARVRRALQGSTAASHSNAAALYIADGWTDYELRENIKEAIRQLRPYFYLDFVGNVKALLNRRQLDDADTANWTQSSEGRAEVLNTTAQKEGTACLDLGATGAGTAIYDVALTSFDFTDYEYLNFWLELADLFDSSENPYLNESAIEVRLGNDATTNYYKWVIHRNELVSGQFFIMNLHRSKATTVGTVDDATIDAFQIRFSSAQAIASGDIKMDEIFVTTFPITSHKRQYQLPRNVFGINEVIAVDMYGNQKDTISYWRVEGEASQKILVFDYDPPTECYLELKGQQLVKVPSGNTTDIALDDTEEEAVTLKAALLSLDSMMNDRIRFDKYSAKLESTKQGVLDIYRAKTQLNTDLNSLIANFGKPLGGTDIDWTDETFNRKRNSDEGVFD